MTSISKLYVSASLCISAGLLAAIPMPASADANLNCGAYANAAVQQHARNLDMGCGFQGGAWSTDYDGHFAWCRQGNVKMANLTAEDNARSAALNQCANRRSSCQAYAQHAVNAHSSNVANNCGFTGGRWSADYQGHLGWCMKAGDNAPNQEILTRNMHMQQCLSK